MTKRDKLSEASLPAQSSDVLGDAFFKARKRELKKRLKRSRFDHSVSVADTAVMLARLHGVDERKARLAGLLHDWDKDYDDEGIRRRVQELGLKVDPYSLENMPALLHGPTAAAALKKAYPDLPCDVVRAIELHTTGAAHMSDLDAVVYIADAIEPTRRYGGLEDVRCLVGQVSLEELFVATFQHILLNLINRRKRVYPRTLEVWNHYIVRGREATNESSTKGTA